VLWRTGLWRGLPSAVGVWVQYGMDVVLGVDVLVENQEETL